MSRVLKVYGGWIFHGGKQVHAVVAAQSQAFAAAALGVKVSHVRTYMSETGNAEEIAQAMSAPGFTFWRPLDDHRAAWRTLGEEGA